MKSLVQTVGVLLVHLFNLVHSTTHNPKMFDLQYETKDRPTVRKLHKCSIMCLWLDWILIYEYCLFCPCISWGVIIPSWVKRTPSHSLLLKQQRLVETSLNLFRIGETNTCTLNFVRSGDWVVCLLFWQVWMSGPPKHPGPQVASPVLLMGPRG